MNVLLPVSRSVWLDRLLFSRSVTVSRTSLLVLVFARSVSTFWWFSVAEMTSAKI